ncbi:Inorganic pyrophosphatase ttm2, variant 3 [Lathyrus oleraceus]|uniref:Inorganic pyrophosphatase ttm2, variant 3 n=1 Tax=Pisum sativum TaxID=3888 RepID=A0A9D5ATW9_PEA|nr:Inorganic pyrophosphatase ttm2, variant 3 [Pisum sativum]
MSQSFTNQEDEDQAKVTGFGAITQLSEQIASLHDRMGKFSNRIEELNSKLTTNENCPNQQNMVLQSESYDGSAPTSYFVTCLSNGSLTGSIMPNSLFPPQLAKDTPLRDEISGIAQVQRQIMNQLDNLNSIFCANLEEKPHQTRTNRKSASSSSSDSGGRHIIAAVAIGCLSIFPAGSQERFERFTELALTIVHSAAKVFAAGWIEVSCWILTGEQQTTVIKSNYVQVLLNQDMSFFDTYGNNGDIVSQVSSDMLLIQSALSKKVGNYIHNMATLFSGLVIGLTNCWQIALITLATGPFIVAAVGISNIFLHRPARISRLENE